MPTAAATLLATSHELSKIWRAKQTYVETEEMKLKEIVPESVLKFKSDKINILRKKILQQIDEASKANDIEKTIALQKKYNTLSKALGKISKSLGDRILL